MKTLVATPDPDEPDMPTEPAVALGADGLSLPPAIAVGYASAATAYTATAVGWHSTSRSV